MKSEMSSADLSPLITQKLPTRRQKLRRFAVALYGEFFATCFLMLPQYAWLANCYQKGWDEEVKTVVISFIAGFQVISMTFAFSEMSGANANCAISISLWLVGRLSNRKVAMYIVFQLLSSLVSTFVIYLTFENPTPAMFETLSIYPAQGANLGKVFATEFFSTFILATTAFTVGFEDINRLKQQHTKFQALALNNNDDRSSSSGSNSSMDNNNNNDNKNVVGSPINNNTANNNNNNTIASGLAGVFSGHNNISIKDITSKTENPIEKGLTIYATTPQSKSGFAPFAIGFVVFSLCLFGGTDGISMNPNRMFGPAIFSGRWDYFYIYVLAEIAGACAAGIMVTAVNKFRLEDHHTD